MSAKFPRGRGEQTHSQPSVYRRNFDIVLCWKIWVFFALYRMKFHLVLWKLWTIFLTCDVPPDTGSGNLWTQSCWPRDWPPCLFLSRVGHNQSQCQSTFSPTAPDWPINIYEVTIKYNMNQWVFITFMFIPYCSRWSLNRWRSSLVP